MSCNKRLIYFLQYCDEKKNSFEMRELWTQISQIEHGFTRIFVGCVIW